MKFLIKNGIIVTETNSFAADIAVKDDVIAAVGMDLSSEDFAEVIDASGKYVLPGAIDVHTHLAMPFGGTVSADDYFTGTRAAACGGTTAVFDFAMQDYGESLPDVIRRRDALCAPDACVDYAFHVGVKDISNGLLDTMQQAVDMGVPSFKVFMVYDFRVSDGVFYQMLSKAQQCNGMISVHAENNDLVSYLVNKQIDEGNTSAWYHYMSRPEFVEEEAVARAVFWAKSLDVPLYIVHLASRGGAETIADARKRGFRIFAETCPQYLEFTCDVFKRDDGRNFVCSPPMKGSESRDALWAAINKGDIQTVATDHCPFKSFEKDWGKDDFRKIPNGCSGIEVMYPYMLSAAQKGKITLNKAVELCSYNPAKIFGCAQKGSLTPGKDADIVIYDPEKQVTIKNADLHSDTDHTIWEGVPLQGYPEKVFARGQKVFDNGKFTGTRGFGRFIKRKLNVNI